MSQPFTVIETQELEAEPQLRALEAILWLAFTIALVTSPAVVIATYRVLL